MWDLQKNSLKNGSAAVQYQFLSFDCGADDHWNCARVKAAMRGRFFSDTCSIL